MKLEKPDKFIEIPARGSSIIKRKLDAEPAVLNQFLSGINL